MSIATRTGDDGETSLMYGKRVPKDHPRVEAYGTLDELNAALGLARSSTTDPWIKEQLLGIQRDLVAIMGELAVAPEDLQRYQTADYPKLVPCMLEKLDVAVIEVEKQSVRFDGWATPGETFPAAALDMARTVCRRAERRIYELQKESPPVRSLIFQYVNRLSDVLWLFARLAETRNQ